MIEARIRAISEIADAYPGLFSYSELLMLDIRDFNLWERKARITNVRRKINALGTMRLAMHGEEVFDQQVRDLADQIELWERPPMSDAEIIANWNDRINELKSSMAKAKVKMMRR